MKHLYALIFLFTIPAYSLMAQNVGIGEASPATKLDIRGDAGSDLLNVRNDAGTSRLYVTESGKVGIGTNSPLQQLDVLGTTYLRTASGPNEDVEQLRIGRFDSDIRYHSIHSRHGSTGNNYLLFNIHDGGGSPYLSQDTVMTLRGDGNVGIGTIAPTQTLDVNGGIRIRQGASNNHVLTSDANGNATWQDIKSAGIGDDLGNHTAGQELNMNGNAISNLATPSSGSDAANKGYVDNNDEWELNGSTVHPISYGSRNVAIGDNTASYPLHVNGKVRVDESGTIGLSDLTNAHLQIGGGLGFDPNEIMFDGTGHVGTVSNDDVRFTLNGSTVMWLKPSGEVGIGTSNPQRDLHVAGYGRFDNNVEVYNSGTKTVQFNENGNNYINSGNVGIGTSAPMADLEINKGPTGDAVMRIAADTDNSGSENDNPRLELYQDDAIVKGVIGLNGDAGERFTNAMGNALYLHTEPSRSEPIQFATSGQSRMTILGNGNVGIGTNSPGYKLEVNGRFKSNGITETSDARMKKDVAQLEDAIGKVQQLRGVSYLWRKDEFPEQHFDDDRQIGVIAQEVEKVLPEVVHTDEDGYKSVEYSHLVPVLIEAIKEQTETIEEKDAEIQQLKQEQQVFRQQTQEKIEALSQRLDKVEGNNASSEARVTK